jgi:hypothetical protein
MTANRKKIPAGLWFYPITEFQPSLLGEKLNERIADDNISRRARWVREIHEAIGTGGSCASNRADRSEAAATNGKGPST